MSGCGSSGCGGCVCTSGEAAQARRPAGVVADPFPAAADPQRVPLHEVLREARSLLTRAGVPSPAADCVVLTGHVLGLPAARVATGPDITPQARDAVIAATQRRASREPLQHITGGTAFRHLDLYVGPGVFIPRPETEVVVGAALAQLDRPGPATVVDLGAGSGAIGLAIATERPQTTVYAVELDGGAVPWLTQNVMRHAEALRRCGSRIIVVMGDAGAVSRSDQPLAELAGRVDLVVSNPPYIPDGLQPRDPEVRDFDPPLALFGGADGLDAVRRWLDTAADLLAPGAALVMEHGDLQGRDDGVPGLLSRHEDLGAAGPVWTRVSDHLDLTGRSRYTIARRSGD